MSEFNTVVASARMSREELLALKPPYTWDQWFLREFILHRERFVDIEGERRTLAENLNNPKCAVNKAFHRGKDSYSMKGVYAPVQVVSK